MTPASSNSVREVLDAPREEALASSGTNRAASTTRWGAIVAIAVQLVLVALVLERLDMLHASFRRVFVLTIAGFVVNHGVPARHRLTFFVAFCALVFAVVLGGSPNQFWSPRPSLLRLGPAIAVTGCTLIGICVLPVAFGLRVGLLLAAGGVLAALRMGVIGPESVLAAWPLLAALFMFRLLVFLYDVSTSKARPRLTEALAYFFLFPNSASTLFPVVDFKTFCRSHYDRGDIEIYRRGLRWIVRGVLQLVAYRLIRQLLSLDADDVASGTDLIQYILACAFTYLQVSGLFHLVVGLLLLFGFNLPETNRRYFLAASFTDYWRRVNIYWKDFILKVFYYPMYFRLRRLGTTTALVVATLGAFLVTWLLHLYQTWWLKGTVGLNPTDMLFWGTLALLVLVNSLWELKRGRERKLAASAYGLRRAVTVVLSTAGTFACVSVLWSLWSTPELGQWLGLWRHADGATLAWGLATLAVIMAATVFFEVRPARRSVAAADARSAGPHRERALGSFAAGGAPLILVLLAATPAVEQWIDSPGLQAWHDALRTGDSMVDGMAQENRGYYERLAQADRANARLWEMLTHRRLGRDWHGARADRRVKDFSFSELLPSVDLSAYDTEIRTNRWGMRDQDYAPDKPADVFRIAMVGSSQLMGWGVPYEQTFEYLVEQRLNAAPPAGRKAVRFEILNFAVPGLSPLGAIDVLRRKVSAFEPDLVLFVSHSIDDDWTQRALVRGLRAGLPITAEFLRQLLRDARITARTNMVLACRRLEPREPELMGWCYREFVQACRDLGALPVAMFLPVPNKLQQDRLKAPEQTIRLRDAGFILVDFAGLFGDRPRPDLNGEDALQHMNSRAHQLVADALFDTLRTDPRLDLNRLASTVTEEGSAAPPPVPAPRPPPFPNNPP